MWQRLQRASGRSLAPALLTAAALLMAACNPAQSGNQDAAALAATVQAQQAQIQQLEERVAQLSTQVNANTAALIQAAQSEDGTTASSNSAPSNDVAATAAGGDAAATGDAAPTATPAAPSPLPTPEPLPSPTPFAAFAPGPLTGEPPAGFARPEGLLADRWAEDAAVQEALGWAVDVTPRTIDVVMQPFERGWMIWRSDDESITVVLTDGQRWAQYPDRFQEGEPELDPTLSPPGGLLQPIRGFGKLWRSQPELREQLGWATDKERPYDGDVQNFERGAFLGVSIERIIAGHAPDGAPIWIR